MASEMHNLPTSSTALAPGDRLDSWKEIAAYLKCSVRTVRRWEQEGLPVRRHAHRKRAAVYAYRAEIDAWWRNGHERLEVSRERRTGWPIVRVAWAAVGLALLVGAAAAVWIYRSPSPFERSNLVQVTGFPDAVTQPALSSDGRMLAFIRGPSTFVGEGEIYVKMLPSGDPVQLTQDGLLKMSPTFSPDGSRIAYTALGPRSTWDTWVVPVLGGKPQLWLPNASGLVWLDDHQLIFSRMLEADHMGLVICLDSRTECHDLYVPANGGMAHRSYPSPDRRWVLAVEMNDRGIWMPCRLLPIDGTSAGRPVGPPGAPCTSAAWSPDGKWMYLSVNTDHNFHIWRQRFPAGRPEQLTSGPDGEEGIALAPDGRSLITAVGLRQRAVWYHDALGDHQVSLEGYALDPRLYVAGRKVLYRRSESMSTRISQMWLEDLDSGENALLLPGLDVLRYDLSADGRIVVAALDAEGKPRLWIAWVDRRSPPRQIPSVTGGAPVFGSAGDIFFSKEEGNVKFLFRVRPDGTGLQKISSQPVIEVHSVSPDGKWVAGLGSAPSEPGWFEYAYPATGGTPVPLCNPPCEVRWSPDGRWMYVSVYKAWISHLAAGRTYILPTRPNSAFPEMPVGGFRSETQLAAIPGVRIIQAADVAPGSAPESYVFSQETTQRNLFRIPLH